jgi:hypothetical protein
MAGVGTMAFGMASLFSNGAVGFQQNAMPFGAIALGLLCWAAGVRLAKMGGNAGQ